MNHLREKGRGRPACIAWYWTIWSIMATPGLPFPSLPLLGNRYMRAMPPSRTGSVSEVGLTAVWVGLTAVWVGLTAVWVGLAAV